jgi:hypothetical protein
MFAGQYSTALLANINEKEKGIERTTKNTFYITGLFVFGVVFLLLIATTSI